MILRINITNPSTMYIINGMVILETIENLQKRQIWEHIIEVYIRIEGCQTLLDIEKLHCEFCFDINKCEVQSKLKILLRSSTKVR